MLGTWMFAVQPSGEHAGTADDVTAQVSPSEGWRASSASRTGTAGGGQSAMCLNKPVFDECNLHFQFHEPEQSSWTRHRNVCYAVQQLYAQDGHEMSASSK